MAAPRRPFFWAVFICAVSIIASACGDVPSQADDEGEQNKPKIVGSADIDAAKADHLPIQAITLTDIEALRRVFSEEGVARFDSDQPFFQVGIRLDALGLDELSFRVQRGDDWSTWQAADIYFREGKLYNALILLEEAARTIEIRGDGPIEFMHLEFSETIQARRPLIRRLDIAQPPNEPQIDPTSMLQAVAPSTMVTSRHEWGAIDPDKICNQIVAPQRMTLHHTAGPTVDTDPHARMRSIQSFHINDRGWCDVGYHFTVAQTGEIMQGRSRANRPGAHARGENEGNVGVSIFGTYSSVDPSPAALEAVARTFRWVHDTFGVPLDRDAVRGHREWPGQATECPGDHGLAQLENILDRAEAITDLSPKDAVASLSMSVAGIEDFYAAGTSLGVLDAIEGQEFVVQVAVKNESSESLSAVELAFLVDEPSLSLASIQIEALPVEPDIIEGGLLPLGELPPGGEKQVTFHVIAQQYNLGPPPRQGLKVWVKSIEGRYDQAYFGEAPTLDHIGQVLESEVTVDVLSRREWHFQGMAPDELEGWRSAREPPPERLVLDPDLGVLALTVTDAKTGLLAPPWFLVDADEVDELILRLRAFDGPHIIALRWAGAGEGLDETRRVRFEAPGDGKFHTFVVPLHQHPRWTGSVERLALTLLDSPRPRTTATRRFEVDHLYFQSQGQRLSGSHTLDIVEQRPVKLMHRGILGPAMDFAEGQGPDIRSNSGCAAVTGGPMGQQSRWWLVVLLLGLVARWRRHPVA